MRRLAPWPVIVLIAAPQFGCGQQSNPPAVPAPSAQKGVDDAVEILKGVNESIKSSEPTPPGTTMGVTQVGSHRLKTVADVPTSSTINEERAVVSLGGRKLSVEFDRGQIFFEEKEKEKVSLPAGTKEVEIQFVGGKISVKADGKVITVPGAER
jgi:hypothetical protein